MTSDNLWHCIQAAMNGDMVSYTGPHQEAFREIFTTMQTESVRRKAKLPDRVDLRSIYGEVRDQGGFGNSTAFATATILRTLKNKQKSFRSHLKQHLEGKFPADFQKR